MSLIPLPQEGIKEETKSLQVGSQTIRLTTHISDSTLTFYFGGHDMYCVHAQIFRKTKDTPYFIDVSVGNLVQVYHDQQCSLEHNFKRGIDTIRLIKLALSYIHDNYPYVKTLKFTDASKRTCDNDNVVNLSEMSYVIYGKTWYETHFAAYLGPKSKAIFDTETRNFQEKKKAMTWDFLYPHITSPTAFPVSVDTLKMIYEQSKTWQDFFSTMKTSMDISDYCSFLSYWLHPFLEKFTSIRFLMFEYYMNVSKDLYIEYSEQNYSKGGKRLTRRRRKNRLQALNSIA